MELNEIRAFVAIADSQSFTRAAEILRISQPAISRRLDLLEQELGSLLFVRLRTGAKLTDAGEAFMPFARQILANVEDGVTAVRAVLGGTRGEITLALVGTLASTHLIERLAGFRNAHPDVRLLLRTSRSDGVSALVQTGQASLGLRYFADSRSGLLSEEIVSEPLAIMCAGSSRLVPPGVVSEQELAGIPWVTYPLGGRSSGEPFARELERILVTLGLDASERIVIDSVTAQKRMVEADFGLGLVPLSAIDEELGLGSLRIVNLHGFAASVPIHLVRRKGGYQSASINHLIASIRGTN